MTTTTDANSVLTAQVLPRLYRDSVALMRIAASIGQREGVIRVGAVMATPANLGILTESQMLPDDLSASPDDLIFVVRGVDEQTVVEALEAAVAALTVTDTGTASAAEQLPGTVEEGIAAAAEDGSPATLATVSVAGTYAAIVAEQAIRRGLHVFCFSDNVPLEDEVRLKRMAVERGLLLMGPDCGTAILEGVPLGFANVVRPGRIGMVAASGTGGQEISRLIDSSGAGISQLIGVGGRDLSAEVGGAMTEFALDLLADDDQTAVVLVVSKPPSEAVANRLIDRLTAIAANGKPAVACLLGLDDRDIDGVRIRGTLEAGAVAAVELDGRRLEIADPPGGEIESVPGRVLGLYTGGTLAAEAKIILGRAGAAATILDLGDDEYTAGKPHPMIDPVPRADRIEAAGSDPEVGVILIDLVLGFGSAADPGTPVARAVRAAHASAARDGRKLIVIASVCGTNGDPQGLVRQRDILSAADVILRPTNASAARLAAASSKEKS